MKKTFTKIIFGLVLGINTLLPSAVMISSIALMPQITVAQQGYQFGQTLKDKGSANLEAETKINIDDTQKDGGAENNFVNGGKLPEVPDVDLGPGSTSPFKEEGTTQCDFTTVQKMKPCLGTATINGQEVDEKKFYMKTVLEESIDTVDVSQYSEGGVQVRQCQRAIQVATCSQGYTKNTQQTFTKYTADGQCKPKGQRGSQDDRIICEDVTFILTPVSGGGAGLLNTYIGFIYRWAAGVVGIIAVLVIIVNAILIITSQGDSGAIEQARTRIVESLGGIAILFLSSVILYAINPNFFKL